MRQACPQLHALTAWSSTEFEPYRMSICLFLSFRLPASQSPDPSEIARLDKVLCATPQLRKALVHTSSRADDPYLDDGPPPQLVLQLYFAELADLEDVLAHDGHLSVLTSHDAFPDLASAAITQQAMLVRTFPVPEPTFENPPGTPFCTYLVAYEGEAEDLNAWHSHYFGNHTRHMARFPGIRDLEIYTRLDWVSTLPCRRVNFMQRNKVVFDSADALTRALNSPIRHELRACFTTFPPFTGPITHFAMATRVLHP
jgi:hypothetical protein